MERLASKEDVRGAFVAQDPEGHQLEEDAAVAPAVESSPRPSGSVEPGVLQQEIDSVPPYKPSVQPPRPSLPTSTGGNIIGATELPPPPEEGDETKRSLQDDRARLTTASAPGRPSPPSVMNFMPPPTSDTRPPLMKFAPPPKTFLPPALSASRIMPQEREKDRATNEIPQEEARTASSVPPLVLSQVSQAPQAPQAPASMTFVTLRAQEPPATGLSQPPQPFLAEKELPQTPLQRESERRSVVGSPPPPAAGLVAVQVITEQPIVRGHGGEQKSETSLQPEEHLLLTQAAPAKTSEQAVSLPPQPHTTVEAVPEKGKQSTPETIVQPKSAQGGLPATPGPVPAPASFSAPASSPLLPHPPPPSRPSTGEATGPNIVPPPSLGPYQPPPPMVRFEPPPNMRSPATMGSLGPQPRPFLPPALQSKPSRGQTLDTAETATPPRSTAPLQPPKMVVESPTSLPPTAFALANLPPGRAPMETVELASESEEEQRTNLVTESTGERPGTPPLASARLPVGPAAENSVPLPTLRLHEATLSDAPMLVCSNGQEQRADAAVGTSTPLATTGGEADTVDAAQQAEEEEEELVANAPKDGPPPTLSRSDHSEREQDTQVMFTAKGTAPTPPLPPHVRPATISFAPPQPFIAPLPVPSFVPVPVPVPAAPNDATVGVGSPSLEETNDESTAWTGRSKDQTEGMTHSAADFEELSEVGVNGTTETAVMVGTATETSDFSHTPLQTSPVDERISPPVQGATPCDAPPLRPAEPKAAATAASSVFDSSSSAKARVIDSVSSQSWQEAERERQVHQEEQAMSPAGDGGKPFALGRRLERTMRAVEATVGVTSSSATELGGRLASKATPNTAEATALTTGPNNVRETEERSHLEGGKQETMTPTWEQRERRNKSGGMRPLFDGHEKAAAVTATQGSGEKSGMPARPEMRKGPTVQQARESAFASLVPPLPPPSSSSSHVSSVKRAGKRGGRGGGGKRRHVHVCSGLIPPEKAPMN